MRPLIGLDHVANAQLGPAGALSADIPIFPLDIEGSLTLPEGENLIDGLLEHLVAIGIETANHFGIRARNARADTEQKTPLEHRVDQRDIRRDNRRVTERQVVNTGAQLDISGLPGEPGDK